ncbi:MAG: 3-dehydroquinate synthase, partial [Bacillota bacterium]
MRNKLKVNLDKDSYEIIIDKDILDKSGQLINSSLNIGNKVLIISDQNVYPLYGERLKNSLQAENYQVQSQIIEPGEKSKSSHELNKIYDLLLESRFDRNSTIIALGGGVVGDLAGMAAATFMRGINFIQIPTSLLAQVDSSVGGKVAINHPEAKNIIGAFYQPEIVIIDIDLLKTLKPRDYNTGLAEVIKYGFGFNQDLFTYIENNIPKIKEINPEVLNKLIYNCCQIKSHIVNQDEKEKGVRAKLNLGHTIGHAVEALTDYQEYTHGEAIAIGMVYEGYLAARLNYIKSEEINRLKNLLASFELPITLPESIKFDELIDKMKSDKKAKDNQIFLALPNSIGDTIITSAWNQS